MGAITRWLGPLLAPIDYLLLPILDIIDDFILDLLGIEDQEVEYYDLVNIPLFPDEETDNKNPTTEVLIASILQDEDIPSNLLYALTQRSGKASFIRFVTYIEEGNYFEGFPAVESHFSYIDYTEITDVLIALNGAPCSITHAKLQALSSTDWIKYWLQENYDYDVGDNILGTSNSTATTSPGSNTDTINVVRLGSDITITLQEYVQTSDDMYATAQWSVDFSATVYNSGTDDYTIWLYNEYGDEVVFDFNAPTKPTQLHYAVQYYVDSAPTREYVFIYQVGSGIYPTLDAASSGSLEDDAAILRAIPAIPLRLNNADYSTFAGSKPQQITDICDILAIDAEELLAAVKSDSGTKDDELDHVYLNFGVRMWDTSAAGMSYLFNMFQNLYATQGVTQGTYDAANAGELPPSNNITINTTDYTGTFRFSYITYTHVTLAEIDADTGSVANGIYYSDMSKFDASGNLVYPYYISSGKGTYNVGYKADNVSEVELFLAGTGVVNPGDTADGAADLMQVTNKFVYPAGFNEADGTASTKTYLHPADMYSNNGGTLQIASGASSVSTTVSGITVGQSITYYYATPSGLDAYTVVAPNGAFRVIDAGSGRSTVIKFNLGARDDLMVPLMYNFLPQLSNTEVTQLFLAGTHVSLYVAYYEYIEVSEKVKMFVIIAVVIIILVTIFTLGTGTGPLMAAFQAALAGTLTVAMVQAALVSIIQSMVIQYIVKMILIQVAKSNPELAMALAAVVAVVALSYGGTSALDVFKIVGVASNLASNIGMILEIQAEDDLNSILEAMDAIPDLTLLEDYSNIFDTTNAAVLEGARVNDQGGGGKLDVIIPADTEIALKIDAFYDLYYDAPHDIEGLLNMQVHNATAFT